MAVEAAVGSVRVNVLPLTIAAAPTNVGAVGPVHASVSDVIESQFEAQTGQLATAAAVAAHVGHAVNPGQTLPLPSSHVETPVREKECM